MLVFEIQRMYVWENISFFIYTTITKVTLSYVCVNCRMLHFLINYYSFNYLYIKYLIYVHV